MMVTKFLPFPRDVSQFHLYHFLGVCKSNVSLGRELWYPCPTPLTTSQAFPFFNLPSNKGLLGFAPPRQRCLVGETKFREGRFGKEAWWKLVSKNGRVEADFLNCGYPLEGAWNILPRSLGYFRFFRLSLSPLGGANGPNGQKTWSGIFFGQSNSGIARNNLRYFGIPFGWDLVGCFSWKRSDQVAYHLLTWNPNDTCFEWKRPCFGGLKHQNRGQTGSRYIYIYIEGMLGLYLVAPSSQWSAWQWNMCVWWVRKIPTAEQQDTLKRLEEVWNFYPLRKLTCPMKWDHSKGHFIFQ